jgi:hypothetical protein
MRRFQRGILPRFCRAHPIFLVLSRLYRFLHPKTLRASWGRCELSGRRGRIGTMPPSWCSSPRPRAKRPTSKERRRRSNERYGVTIGCDDAPRFLDCGQSEDGAPCVPEARQTRAIPDCCHASPNATLTASRSRQMDSNTTSGANASTGSRIRYLRHPTLLLTRAADEE